VVCEVVDHAHAHVFAADFLASGHAFEGSQAVADFGVRESGEGSGCGGHGGVADIEFAGHSDRETRAVPGERGFLRSVIRVGDADAAIRTEAHRRDRTGSVRGGFEADRVIAVHEGHAVARDDVEQASERKLDLGERRIDVGMVELDIVHHHAFGKVVEELRSFVEEGRIVLIAFEYGERRVREERAAAEVARDAADHVARVATCVAEQPGEH
jgi:hypothetical protein